MDTAAGQPMPLPLVTSFGDDAEDKAVASFALGINYALRTVVDFETAELPLVALTDLNVPAPIALMNAKASMHAVGCILQAGLDEIVRIDAQIKCLEDDLYTRLEEPNECIEKVQVYNARQSRDMAFPPSSFDSKQWSSYKWFKRTPTYPHSSTDGMMVCAHRSWMQRRLERYKQHKICKPKTSRLKKAQRPVVAVHDENESVLVQEVDEPETQADAASEA